MAETEDAATENAFFSQDGSQKMEDGEDTREKTDTEDALDGKAAGHASNGKKGGLGHADAQRKKATILEACRTGDLDSLRALAESPGGFLADSIRQQACKCRSRLALHRQ